MRDPKETWRAVGVVAAHFGDDGPEKYLDLVADIASEIHEVAVMKLAWTNETPPIGVWAYSVEDGLFCIERKTETHYLELIRVVRFERKRLETSTRYTMAVHGPFVYPMPDPTKGVAE